VVVAVVNGVLFKYKWIGILIPMLLTNLLVLILEVIVDLQEEKM
jgi:hypothetical protein